MVRGAPVVSRAPLLPLRDGPMKPPRMTVEARAWAGSVKAAPSRVCQTCDWAKKNPRAGEFLAGVADVVRDGGHVPLARLYDEILRRFSYPLTYSGLRCHWEHVKRAVKHG